MTIFKQIHELECGLKTVTRRVVKPGDVTNRWYLDGPEDDRICEVLAPRAKPTSNGFTYRTVYAIGKDYAIVPKRGKASIGRYQLVSIAQERLQDITEESAVAEGLEDMIFPPFHRTSVLPGQVFSSAREGYEALWKSINTKAPYRWIDNPAVWVLTIQVLHINGKQVQS